MIKYSFLQHLPFCRAWIDNMQPQTGLKWILLKKKKTIMRGRVQSLFLLSSGLDRIEKVLLNLINVEDIISQIGLICKNIVVLSWILASEI